MYLNKNYNTFIGIRFQHSPWTLTSNLFFFSDNRQADRQAGRQGISRNNNIDMMCLNIKLGTVYHL